MAYFNTEVSLLVDFIHVPYSALFYGVNALLSPVRWPAFTLSNLVDFATSSRELKISVANKKRLG